MALPPVALQVSANDPPGSMISGEAENSVIVNGVDGVRTRRGEMLGIGESVAMGGTSIVVREATGDGEIIETDVGNIEVEVIVGAFGIDNAVGVTGIAPHADRKTRINHHSLIFTGIFPFYTERQPLCHETIACICS